MASPNQKAGLAVVIPTSDNRSPTQRKFKQHALNVPRNRLSQSNGFTSPRPVNVGSTPRQPNPPPASRQQNEPSFRRQSTGVAPYLPSKGGNNPTQPRLLNVDQALQFSPFASVVPFGPGENCGSPQTSASDCSRYYTNSKCESPWLSTNLSYFERTAHVPSAAGLPK